MPQIVHNARSPCSLLKYRSPHVHVFAAKKTRRISTFLRLCRSDLQKNTEINGIKFKRGCLDKIDWNSWIPDWDVNENKRLEIVSADSFSGVFLFSFSLFLLFFKLDSKFWISGVNDGKRPLFFFFPYHFDLATESNEKTQCMLVVLVPLANQLLDPTKSYL